MSIYLAKIFFLFYVFVTSSLAYKTMTAQEVADAMSNQAVCSSSIADDACLSTKLISVEEWKYVKIAKDAVMSLTKDTLCPKLCNGSCGPLYFYATNFNVLYGGASKAAFAEIFSRDLLSALNARHECDGVFLFFFSRADRLIALRAPYGSYLYKHTGEIYNYVKSFYTRAMDEPGFSFALAANATMLSLYSCVTHDDNMCTSKKGGGAEWKTGYSILVFVGVCLIVVGIVVCLVICCDDGKRGTFSSYIPSYNNNNHCYGGGSSGGGGGGGGGGGSFGGDC